MDTVKREISGEVGFLNIRGLWSEEIVGFGPQEYVLDFIMNNPKLFRDYNDAFKQEWIEIYILSPGNSDWNNHGVKEVDIDYFRLSVLPKVLVDKIRNGEEVEFVYHHTTNNRVVNRDEYFTVKLQGIHICDQCYGAGTCNLEFDADHIPEGMSIRDISNDRNNFKITRCKKYRHLASDV